MTTQLVDTSGRLSHFSYTDVVTCPLLFENDTGVMRLWQAACIAQGAHNQPIYRIPYETNANLLAQSIRSPTLEDTGPARSHKRARQVLDVPDTFDNAGPAKKALLLETGDNAPETIQRCISTGPSVNVLRHAALPLPSIASGIQ